MINSLIGHTDAVTSLSLNPNNNILASASCDGSIRNWDLRKYSCLHEFIVN